MDNATVQDQAQHDTEQQPEEKEQGQPESAPARSWSFRMPDMNSPWILIAVSVIAGIWLLFNPSVILNNLQQPLLFFIVPSVTIVALLCWQALLNISRFLDFLRRSMNRTTFFWIVNIVFMAISSYHAAPFFSSVGSGIPGTEWLAPYIGLPVAIVLDAIVIVFQQARLEAVYKRDKQKAKKYLSYVLASAALSTIGNLYTSFQDFDAAKYNHLQNFTTLAPVFLSMFPVFIVFISQAADELVSVKPLEKIDEKQFEDEQNKRANILRIQNDAAEKMVEEERRMINLERKQRENDLLRKGKSLEQLKERRTFFLKRLLFPLDTDTEALKAQLAEEQKQSAKEQQEAMQKQLDTFFKNAQNAYNNLALLVEKQAQSIAQIDAQRDTDNALMMEHIRESQQTMQAQITDAIATLSHAIKTSEATTEKAGYTTAYKPAKAPFINAEAGQGKEVLKGKDKTPYTGTANTDEYPVISQSDAQDTEEPITDSINLSALTSEELPANLPQDIAEVVKTYPQVYFEWIAKDVKSVDIDSIVEVTSQPKRRVQYHAGKTFTRTPKNPKLYTVTSVLKWLRTAPSVSGSTDELSVVIPASNGNHNGQIQGVLSDDLEEQIA